MVVSSQRNRRAFRLGSLRRVGGGNGICRLGKGNVVAVDRDLPYMEPIIVPPAAEHTATAIFLHGFNSRFVQHLFSLIIVTL